MMSKRGAANIANYNSGRQQNNDPLVEYELQQCQKHKLFFNGIAHMASFLSAQTKLSRSTFTRNVKYKKLILIYLQSQPGAVSIIDDRTEDLWILKAKLAATQSEVGILRQEVKRLVAQIPRENSEPPILVGPNKSDVDFANLCVILCLVISKAEHFAVDRQNKVLIDLASRPSDSQVGGPERVGAFIAWLDQNPTLPFVKSLKRV